MAGYRDSIDNLAREFARHAEYGDASRAYSKDFGSQDDYRNGYQQGFEAGYDTGFEKRSFDATVPAGLKLRDKTPAAEPAAAAQTQEALTPEPIDEQAAVTVDIPKVSYIQPGDDSIIIPRETELIIELDSDLNTDKNKVGDTFTARVVSPAEVSGAVIEGRIEKIMKPGRLKRRSELSLSFDRIVINENRWGNMAATLTEVLPIKGDNVKMVDREGTAIGKSSIKSDSVKVGAAATTGTVVGAVAGGPVGAAVGAGVGAAFGVGAVVIQRGKHVNLLKNQQLRLKTDFELRIR
jgi:hypothetical protein